MRQNKGRTVRTSAHTRTRGLSQSRLQRRLLFLFGKHFYSHVFLDFFMFQSACLVMSLPISLPSAIAPPLESWWAEQSYLSSPSVPPLQSSCTEGEVSGVNGRRLMHNEWPYYANEVQQPLSYVPQNSWWLMLMATFSFGWCRNP